MAGDEGNRPPLSRRAVLRTVGAASLAGVGLAGCTGVDLGGVGSSPDQGTATGTPGSGGANGSADGPTATEVGFATTRDTYRIMEGTMYETTVHVLDSAADGRTAVLVGGMHGNETGGVEAAHVATEYDVGRGTVVVLPEANRPAVKADEREGPDGDLNRQFPVGERPTTGIARAVWGVLREHDPDCVIDMHTSKAVYRLHDTGVGQVVFPHGGQDPIEDARAGAERVNRRYLSELLGDELPDGYAFEAVYGEYELPHMDREEENLLLASKAARDLGAESWVTEVTYRGFDLEEVTFLHDRLTTALLERNAFPIRSPLDDADNPLLD